MPLYEYVCQKCDHSFEALIFGADDDTTCPKCESQKVEKQFSLPARPQTETTSLPMGCNSEGPPCGPVCSRFNGEN
jgi:putative FmdB family regulatory protein